MARVERVTAAVSSVRPLRSIGIALCAVGRSGVGPPNAAARVLAVHIGCLPMESRSALRGWHAVGNDRPNLKAVRHVPIRPIRPLRLMRAFVAPLPPVTANYRGKSVPA
jgi:hypothetical protein